MEIKVLARRGTAVREIARQTGLSRNTVRRYLRDAQAGRYKQRELRPTKLDPFKGCLLERVAAARPHWIPATVLLRELQEAGYQWAEEHDITDPSECSGNSTSFIEGCEAYAEENSTPADDSEESLTAASAAPQLG